MLRGFIWQAAARDAWDNAQGKWARTDDAVAALEWGIGHDPTNGKALTESGNMRSITLQGGRSIDLPTIVAIYEITEQNIIVHSMRFSDAEGQSGRA